MPHLNFQFHPYQRTFKQPLVTSHGLWKVREGIILQLRDESGRVGYGEIAPLEWFGSETLAQALDFCRQLPSRITTDDIFAIPSTLVACQFGFESAWEDLRSPEKVPAAIPMSGLLPSGKAAITRWRKLWEQGYRTFKWKIGIAPLVQELGLFEELVQVLPPGTKLRLDANAGLSFTEASEWLKLSDMVNTNSAISIEFLEQPLPTAEFTAMLHLSSQYYTSLALDESVANIHQLQQCYQQGWRGVFVIKPAIAGSPKLLRQFCQQCKIDAVFSTVFETSIGRQFALKLCAELSQNQRAAGFGVSHWFTGD